jgi:hypothetical protein
VARQAGTWQWDREEQPAPASGSGRACGIGLALGSGQGGMAWRGATMGGGSLAGNEARRDHTGKIWPVGLTPSLIRSSVIFRWPGPDRRKLSY